MKDQLEKLKQKYNDIPLGAKRAIIISALVLVVIALGFIKSGVDQTIKKEDKGEEQEIPLSRDIMEKSYYMKALEENESNELKVEKLQRSLQDLQGEIKAMKMKDRNRQRRRAGKQRSQQAETESKDKQGRPGENRIVKSTPEEFRKSRAYPPPPPEPDRGKRSLSGNQDRKMRLIGRRNRQKQKQFTAGIALVSNEQAREEKGSQRADEKEIKKKKRFLLPPSFMEATLLSGVDAPTSETGKANPVPLFFRIKAPAVLPNEVKANLKGCFLVGEGTGRLDTERVDVRLVNLSCVDIKGRGVIVSPIKGYIADADSKIGLKGRVVSKMGSVLARHLLAGVIGGVAEAAKAAGTEQSTTEFGMPVTTVKSDTESAFKAGLGEGMSDSFKELQQFYLDLAKQTLPVVEIGALKEVVAVVTQEAVLEVKDIS